MSSKLDELKRLQDRLNIEIKGENNYPTNGKPTLIVANHTCLMDIFYLPMALPESTLSLVGSRVIYKPNRERQEVVKRYLNTLPLEARGGNLYANLCLENATEVLRKGISINMFPQGVYTRESSVIGRSRTGMSRILFGAKEHGTDVNLVPVAIDIEGDIEDLDNYSPTDNCVRVSILPSIEYGEEYDLYASNSSKKIRNDALHMVADKSFVQVASALNKPYSLEYLGYPYVENVMFEDGTVLPISEASKDANVKRYRKELREYTNGLCKGMREK